MIRRLQQELRQTKPFESAEQEALLNIQRTSDMLRRRTQQLLKPHGLTGSQYNALRILRGAGPDGLRCSEVGERMVSHDPDITRMLDRLERRGLIERWRDSSDKRVVHTRIQPDGLALLETLDPIVRTITHELLAHVPAERIQTLIDILEEVRATPLPED